jgi:hypothetical protein
MSEIGILSIFAAFIFIIGLVIAVAEVYCGKDRKDRHDW